MTVELLTEHHFEFLSLKGGCTRSSESIFVKMPHWKSHVTAHIFFSLGPSQSLSAAQLQLLQQAAQAQAVQAQAAKAEAAKVLAHATAQGTAGKTVAQGKCYKEVLSHIAPDKDWRQLGIYPPLFGLIGYFKI